MIRTDRILGVVVVIVALVFITSAYNLPQGNLFDKLGPKAFPMIVAVGMILSAAGLILRPDPEADWPATPSLVSIALATLVLIGYAYSLKPLGFLAPTAVAAAILSYQITPRPLPAILTGIGLSGGLFIIFKYALGLGLFAFPRGFFG
jgi:putative tricarboxylic transport membrane protein